MRIVKSKRGYSGGKTPRTCSQIGSVSEHCGLRVFLKRVHKYSPGNKVGLLERRKGLNIWVSKFHYELAKAIGSRDEEAA